MTRNREFSLYLAISLAISLLAIWLAWRIDRTAGLITLALAVSLVGLFVGLTVWRYREIRNLSELLNLVARGVYNTEPIESQEGELSVLRSELYKLIVTLREQAEMLDHDKRFLMEAISDISHQLKTPLTSMNVMVDLLRDEHLSVEKRLEFTHNIHSQLLRMRWLVSSLLTLARLDAGAIQFQPTAVLVKQLVDDSVAHLLIPMEIKQQTLELVGDDALAFAVDRKWTAEAISNVVKNCIEHTPEGGLVSISWQDTALFAEIKIRDNGPGIDLKDLPFVFDRFYKGRQSGKESVGIGLAMSQTIVKAQNGTIEAENCLPHGAQFTLKFYKPL
ncbi:MAG: HAMP domain-containing histidine kinase [Chloroflexi bacterium]|nr:HAMP domain-containing histidine kinase [Chloroflexota bacterium]